MLEIKNVSFGYDDRLILDNINLSLNNNKIYGLIGKNGIGKTTFLKVLTRYISTNTGDIILNNKMISKADFLDTNITYVFDDCIIFNDLTFIEHLNLIAKSSNLSKNECIEFIQIFLKELDLEKYQNSYPSTLSKGTLQRLNIGMGLIRYSPYLFMDEPFNGLDPVQTTKSLDFIKSYKKTHETTIIISSHQLDYLENICDDYLIMTSDGITKIKKNHISEQEIIEILSNDTII